MLFLKFKRILLVAIFTNSFGQETSFSVPQCVVILRYVEENFPCRGVLKISHGFVYVDLDDKYVHKLITFLTQDGFKEPPYFGNTDLVGAHITVASPEETERYRLKEIQECGDVIPFTLKRCEVVHPPKWKEIDELYLIVVESPELDKIRKKYGLPKQEYDFHITIGVKPKVAHSA